MTRMTRRLVTLASVAVAVLAGSLLPAAAVQAKTASAPTCGSTVYKADGSPWICTFDDEFSGSSLDTKKWLPITTADNGQTSGGGQNTPAACYSNSKNLISVSGGYLNLSARKVAPLTCKSPLGDFVTPYVTGQVGTWNKFAQTYGRFTVRAAFPSSTVSGLQSSLWLWPQDNVSTGLTGEIDIAEEYSSYADRVVPYLHYALDQSTVAPATDTNIYTNYYCMMNDVGGFHDYTVVWTPSSITIDFDGTTCIRDNLQTLGTSPFDQPYFVNLTQALGIGNDAFDPKRTPLPATTKIDYVRVWK